MSTDDARPPGGEVTQLLRRLPEEPAVLDELLPLIYEELRQLARGRLAGERPDPLLQTTALIHEAYLRLGGQQAPWQGRAHFFGAAATAMRRILIDHARARARQRRGGDPIRVTLEPELAASPAPAVELLDLDQALERLQALDARKARALEMHYFAGMEYAEIAAALEVSPATCKRDLQFARAWLKTALADGA